VRWWGPGRWPAFGAVLGALAYAAMKVCLAVDGRGGIVGFPTRPGADAAPVGQWGNAAAVAAVALATVRPWAGA
jgi:hypothetical protein